MSYTVQSNRLNKIQTIYAVYEDVLTVDITNLNQDRTESNMTTAVMNIAKYNTDSLLKTVSGVVVDNVATFTIDTADLPDEGDYSFQIFVDGTYTIAQGCISLFALIK